MRSTASVYGPGTRFFAWVVGLGLLPTGLIVLVLPNQFAAPAYDVLRPHLPAFGVAYIAAGVLLVSWQVLPLNERWLVPLSFCLAAATIGGSLHSFVRAQNWSASLTFGLVLIGLAMGAAGVERFFGLHIELFTALAAVGRAGLGLLLIAFPGQWELPIYAYVRSHLVLWGAGFLIASALLLLRLVFRAHRWSRFLALPAAAVTLLWMYEIAGRPASPAGLVSNALVGIGIAVEPFVPAARLCRPRAGLRMKLIAGSIGLVSLTVLLLVLGVLRQSEVAYEDRSEQDLSTVAALSAGNVHDFVIGQERAAQLVSALPAVRNMDPAATALALRAIVSADPTVTLAGVSDLTGALVASSAENLPPSSGAQPAGVSTILQTEQAAIEVAQSPRLGTPALFVRSPIFATGGGFAGFYSSVVSLATLNHEFGTLPLGEAGRIIILDRDGRVVVHPDARLVDSRTDLSALAPVQAVGRWDLRPLVYRDGGTLWLSAQTRVPEVGWTVLVQRPQATVLAPANAARGRALVLLLAVLVFSTGAMVVVGRTVSRPMVELAAAAAQLGEGSYDAPLPAASTDEIGDLVRAFERMRVQLQTRTEERARAEEELRVSEERFRTMVETSLEGIYTVDGEYRITFANVRIAAMLGYTVEELQGLPVETFIPERQRSAAVGELDRRRRGVAEVLEVPIRRKDGSEIWGRIASSPVLDQDGSFGGAVVMITDITEQRRTAAEREELLRAEQLARAELAQRTEELEAKTAEQDAFLYTVSHDLKAPLVSMRGMAQLLEQDAAPRLLDDDRHYIARIVDNAERLARLLDDLLALSRVGRTNTEVDAVSLAEILDDVRSELSTQIAARQARLIVETPLPAVTGNRSRVGEVFMNLIDNAIKYTPAERAPEIRVGARDAGDMVECWVSDNGVGILPDQRERVFGLFTRLPDGKRLHAGGTGAGLAIVLRVIKLHGGSIWLDGDGRQGSTFRFTLPAATVGERHASPLLRVV